VEMGQTHGSTQRRGPQKMGEKEMLEELTLLLRHLFKFMEAFPEGVGEQIARSCTVVDLPLGHVSPPPPPPFRPHPHDHFRHAFWISRLFLPRVRGGVGGGDRPCAAIISIRYIHVWI